MRECGTTKNDICDLLRLRTNDLSDRGRSKSKTHEAGWPGSFPCLIFPPIAYAQL